MRLFGKANLDNQEYYGPNEDFKFCPETEANLETSISSEQPDPFTVMHRPVLDIDVPHEYRESSTPGHGHLLINVDIPWDKFVKWLELSAELGIIEHGYAKASKARGFASIRKKGLKKTKAQQKSSYPEPITVGPSLGGDDTAAIQASIEEAYEKIKLKQQVTTSKGTHSDATLDFIASIT